MGTRGPKPFTKEQLKARGTYRDDRHASRPSSVPQPHPELSGAMDELPEASEGHAPNFSPTMLTFWCQITEFFSLEPHEMRILCLACVAWDRASAARAVIDEQGTTFTDRFGQPRARPELKIEIDEAQLFERMMRSLNLDAKAAMHE